MDLLGCDSRVHNILTTAMTNFLVDKSPDNAKPRSISEILNSLQMKAALSPCHLSFSGVFTSSCLGKVKAKMKNATGKNGNYFTDVYVLQK